MTLIGAFRCAGGAVLFADRQETISDYAKWDVGKIKHLELQGSYRVLMAGAGDADTIDMVWYNVLSSWHDDLGSGRGFEDITKFKAAIGRTVATITRKCILPYSSKDRPWIDLIWGFQEERSLPNTKRYPFVVGPELFRTRGFTVLPINSFYATGNPLLLVRYLEAMFLDGVIFSIEEAEALASYLLWEATEIDPTCGKHYDIFVLKDDGSIGRMTAIEQDYWDDHFKQFKQSLRLLPLLSCAASPITQQIYDRNDYLARFVTAMKTLATAQARERKKTKTFRTSLEAQLMKNLRKTAAKFQPKP